jgi:AcrR family transcriptional regulator
MKHSLHVTGVKHMGKPKNPETKPDLLERIANYVLENGLIDLSLRPLAATLDTNARMLLYHFGSKEQLVIEVLGTIQQRQQAALEQIIVPKLAPKTRFKRLWAWLSAPEQIPFLRTLFEVELRAIDGTKIYQEFARASLLAWMDVVGLNLTRASPATINFVTAALVGLLLDRFSTGDIARTEAAFNALTKTLHEGGLL